MAKKVQTQAMRALDAHKIPYQIHFIPNTVHSAEGVADHLGVPLGQVFKTLVVMHEDESNKRPFDVYLDEYATKFTELFVSAGQRGVELQLKVSDLIAITGAQMTRATQDRV